MTINVSGLFTNNHELKRGKGHGLLVHCVAHDHFTQLDDMRVSRGKQGLYLAQAGDGESIVRVLHLELLDGHDLACGRLSGP